MPGMSPMKVLPKLNRLLEVEAALSYDAVTVNPLRHIRLAKRQRT